MPILRAFKNLALKFLTLIFYTPSQEASGEEVARSRIEYDSPKIILYITFGIAFFVIVLTTLTKPKRDEKRLEINFKVAIFGG
ncbi:hypothetical protein [Campylobacter concisus]